MCWAANPVFVSVFLDVKLHSRLWEALLNQNSAPCRLDCLLSVLISIGFYVPVPERNSETAPTSCWAFLGEAAILDARICSKLYSSQGSYLLPWANLNPRK